MILLCICSSAFQIKKIGIKQRPEKCLHKEATFNFWKCFMFNWRKQIGSWKTYQPLLCNQQDGHWYTPFLSITSGKCLCGNTDQKFFFLFLIDRKSFTFSWQRFMHIDYLWSHHHTSFFFNFLWIFNFFAI